MTRKHYLMLIVAGLMLWASTGCEKPLFPPNQLRSQYERFSYLRGASAPPPPSGPFADDEIDLYARLRPSGDRY